MTENDEENNLLPHHEQQELCTTRLPYRQGRKLTAVKVYTVNNESNHLLIFGVPSLNLRQEAKSLLAKFGKLRHFNLTTHAIEPFTECYHATYESIQMARVAKRMLDTKNFYGGSLHICYAPELETIDETRQKLVKRQQDVTYRLVNLNKESEKKEKFNLDKKEIIEALQKNVCAEKLNMGEINMINVTKNPIAYSTDFESFKNKRKINREHNVVIEKKFKPCFVDETRINNTEVDLRESTSSKTISKYSRETKKNFDNTEIEIIDCTSVETETITNIDDGLNYNKFGNEIIRKIPEKPVNKIKFYVNKTV